MSKKSVNVEPEIHEKAKIISAKTGLTIGEIFGLLIEGLTEKDIQKLAKEKDKDK
ncbi:MAG TPA: hypothetical protein PKK94_26415 [Leptospiraceae bacterium]|nr:hypothetical protein [Leptospiraceae bacterium]